MSSEMKSHARSRNARRKLKDGYSAVFSPQVAMPAAHNYIPDNQVYKISQTVAAGGILTTSVTLPTFAVLSMNFSQLDQAASFEAVFDQYRFDEVEAWIYPRLSSNNSASGNPGLFASVIDYDDANALTTFPQALDYTNCVTSSGLMGHYHRFRPHCATAAYSGAFTSYANMGGTWIDMASPTVIFYGVKLASTVTSSVETYDTIFRFHFSLRNVR
jgi:hypothetical protein